MDTADEPQKSIWRKSWTGPRGLLLFFVAIVVSVYAIIFGVGFLSGMGSHDIIFMAKLAGFLVVVAVCIALAVVFVRWFLRHPRKALFGLACLAIFFVLLYVEEDMRGKWAWNRFRHDWEAKGEKFDFNSLIPARVPDDQNFAMTPVGASTYDWMLDKNGRRIDPPKTNAYGLLLRVHYYNDWNTPTNGNWAAGIITDLRPWQEYYRTPQTNAMGAVTNEFPIAPKPQTPAEDVLLALSKYDSTVEELRQASRLPESRFPLEYDKDDPAAILLPHLSRLIEAAQCLELRSVAELRTGQADKAAADVKLMLYLVQSVRTEPILISHLVRIRMLNFAVQPIYEGLVERRWTEPQLAELESDLAQFNFAADYKFTMRGEVVFTVKTVDFIRQTRNLSSFSGNAQTMSPWVDKICFASPNGWFRQNQIRFAEFYLQQCLPIADPENRTISPKAARQAQTYMNASVARVGPYNILPHIFLPLAESMNADRAFGANKFAFAQESVDLARVAIVLERDCMAHGKYPEALAALAPQFIDKLPHDVIGGGPLKYSRTDNGFVLYSIGWNEKDDGGVSASMKNGLLNSDDGDWVWQSAAKD